MRQLVRSLGGSVRSVRHLQLELGIQCAGPKPQRLCCEGPQQLDSVTCAEIRGCQNRANFSMHCRLQSRILGVPRQDRSPGTFEESKKTKRNKKSYKQNSTDSHM